MPEIIIAKGCAHCGGALIQEDDLWVCIACWRYRYAPNPLKPDLETKRVYLPGQRVYSGRHNKTVDEIRWPDGVKSWKW